MTKLLKDYSVIFGGSFDPPHVGHQAIVMWLVDSLNAGEVIIAPTFNHCFGKNLSDFEHRMKMCKEAFSRYKDRVTVSVAEKHMPQPNITHNLLQWYAQSRDNLAVVIGADNLGQIHRWQDWDKVVKIAKVIAIGRPGFEDSYALEREYDFDVDIYPVGISTVSSTEVREKILLGEPLDGFVSVEVAKYIKEHELYL